MIISETTTFFLPFRVNFSAFPFQRNRVYRRAEKKIVRGSTFEIPVVRRLPAVTSFIVSVDKPAYFKT